MSEPAEKITLFRVGDRLFLRREGRAGASESDDQAKTPVKLLWARPITARGGAVAVMTHDQETGHASTPEELLLLPDLDALDPGSRKVAEEELAQRYIFPRITRVNMASASFGIRYWRVETDRGDRHFALKNASKNAVWITDDHLVLQDTLGCRYEINPFSALDEHSKVEVDRVL